MPLRIFTGSYRVPGTDCCNCSICKLFQTTALAGELEHALNGVCAGPLLCRLRACVWPCGLGLQDRLLLCLVVLNR